MNPAANNGMHLTADIVTYSSRNTSASLVVYRGDLFAAFVLHLPLGLAPASLTVSRPYLLFSMSMTGSGRNLRVSDRAILRDYRALKVGQLFGCDLRPVPYPPRDVVKAQFRRVIVGLGRVLTRKPLGLHAVYGVSRVRRLPGIEFGSLSSVSDADVFGYLRRSASGLRRPVKLSPGRARLARRIVRRGRRFDFIGDRRIPSPQFRH